VQLFPTAKFSKNAFEIGFKKEAEKSLIMTNF